MDRNASIVGIVILSLGCTKEASDPENLTAVPLLEFVESESKPSEIATTAVELSPRWLRGDLALAPH